MSDDIGDYCDYDGEGHGYDCDCEECTEQYHMDNCGKLPPHLGGGCLNAGSEYCDFDCPFRNRVLNGEEDDDDE